MSDFILRPQFFKTRSNSCSSTLQNVNQRNEFMPDKNSFSWLRTGIKHKVIYNNILKNYFFNLNVAFIAKIACKVAKLFL